MIFSIFAGLVAFMLSCVSAYYSVLGLMAIFSSAVVPIIIMGATLELGKVATVLWLHRYWKHTSLRLKLYLVPAVIVLMLLTSVGSFGFLSKAHIDQTVPSAGVTSQLSILDDQIKIQQDNIANYKKELAQLNQNVTEMMNRTTDATGVLRSEHIQKQQNAAQKTIFANIALAQKTMLSLQEQRIPIAQLAKKADADVGPIKYIAALIYGNNATDSMLESAVRIVIILIVLVFDPLAIVLLLSATSSIEWINKEKESKSQNEKESNQRFADLEGHREKSNEIIRKQDEEIKRLQQSVADSVEIQKQKELELSEIVTSFRSMTDDISELMALNAELKNNINDTRERESLLAENLQTMLAQNSETEDIYNSVTQDNLKLTETLEQLTIDYENSKLIANRLQHELTEIKENLRNISEENTRYLEKNKDIESKNSAQILIIESLREKETEYESKLSNTISELESVQQELTKLKIDSMAIMYREQSLIDKITELEDLTNTQASEVENYRVIANDSTRKLGDAEDRVFELETENNILRIDYNDAKHKYETMSKDMAVLEGHAAELATSLNKYKQDSENLALLVEELTKLENASPHSSETLLEANIAPPAPSNAPTISWDRRDKVTADNFPTSSSNADFGTSFPAAPLRGDIFLRVDYMPSKLFKWTGTQWIAIDNTVNNPIVYDEEFITSLINKLEREEISPDALNPMEEKLVREQLYKVNRNE